jgi:hypothetical protein
VRGCADRAEEKLPARGPGPQQRRIGPGYFDSDFPFDDPTLKPPPGERFIDAKTGFTLHANTRATLVVPTRYRRDLGLNFILPTPDRATFTEANGGAAVTFQTCDPSTPAAHHDWRVGEWTRFNGGFFYRRPGCYPVDLFVEGRARPYRVVLSFAAGRCRSH